jgi:hypothetical protein
VVLPHAAQPALLGQEQRDGPVIAKAVQHGDHGGPVGTAEGRCRPGEGGVACVVRHTDQCDAAQAELPAEPPGSLQGAPEVKEITVRRRRGAKQRQAGGEVVGDQARPAGREGGVVPARQPAVGVGGTQPAPGEPSPEHLDTLLGVAVVMLDPGEALLLVVTEKPQAVAGRNLDQRGAAVVPRDPEPRQEDRFSPAEPAGKGRAKLACLSAVRGVQGVKGAGQTCKRTGETVGEPPEPGPGRAMGSADGGNDESSRARHPVSPRPLCSGRCWGAAIDVPRPRGWRKEGVILPPVRSLPGGTRAFRSCPAREAGSR